jgi:hypothetical protein
MQCRMSLMGLGCVETLWRKYLKASRPSRAFLCAQSPAIDGDGDKPAEFSEWVSEHKGRWLLWTHEEEKVTSVVCNDVIIGESNRLP